MKFIASMTGSTCTEIRNMLSHFETNLVTAYVTTRRLMALPDDNRTFDRGIITFYWERKGWVVEVYTSLLLTEEIIAEETEILLPTTEQIDMVAKMNHEKELCTMLTLGWCPFEKVMNDD